MQRIAIIGSGIAGLAAARRLSVSPAARQVTVFEAAPHFGGHANTVDVTLEGITHGVDTGFLVYNERTYPRLVELLRSLGVETAASDMSFSVQARERGIEWSGTDLASVFAQPMNLLRPSFWRMLADIARFNRLATGLARRADDDDALSHTVGTFLHAHRFSTAFRDWYLLPMVACIWSCPPARMLEFPVATLIRFCHNHGLLQVLDRPQWYTVAGGSRQYVQRIVAELDDARLATPVRSVRRSPAGALVATDHAVEHFDDVVFACHSDQALRLLGEDATPDEVRVLGAIGYQPNHAVLHTDASLLPTRGRAWASWNHESARDGNGREGVCLHYLLNRLQPLPWKQPVIVTLNPLRPPREDAVLRRFDYEHPVFDRAAIEAQGALPRIQGVRRSWFCGAWTRYGFHEDGLVSGIAVADALQRASRVPLRGAA